MKSPPVLYQTACHLQDINFYEIGYAANCAMPYHTHAEAHLAFSVEGTITSAWRKLTILTQSSTLTYLPPEEPHATRFNDGARVFLITLSSSWLARLQQYAPLVDRPVIFQNDLPVWLAIRLYREFQRRDSLTPLMMEGLLLELLAQMARETACKPERDHPRWLGQARDFLHAHFRENLSLDTVAAAVGVHPAHLTRAFRQHYHCTLGDYVRRLRVEYASHLLTTSEMLLACIAFEAGFADQSHFSRTFKSLTGMTPAVFQKASGRAGLKQEMLP